MGEVSSKVQESSLRWCRQVLRREDEYVGKRVMVIEVPGKRRTGDQMKMIECHQERLVGERIVRGGSARPG